VSTGGECRGEAKTCTQQRASVGGHDVLLDLKSLARANSALSRL
jgi:hypothetical protein